MLARFGAPFAAVGSARGRHLEHDPEKWVPVFRKRSCSKKKINFRTWAALAAAAALLAGCLPQTVPLAGADPADPSAKAARAGYRSTIAPYTSLRPSTPAPESWRDRNDSVAPPSRPAR